MYDTITNFDREYERMLSYEHCGPFEEDPYGDLEVYDDEEDYSIEEESEC